MVLAYSGNGMTLHQIWKAWSNFMWYTWRCHFVLQWLITLGPLNQHITRLILRCWEASKLPEISYSCHIVLHFARLPTTLLLGSLSNFKAIEQFVKQTSWLRDLRTSFNKTSDRIFQRPPCLLGTSCVRYLSGANTLQWRHNERDGFSNHRHSDCLLKRFFRSRWKKTSKLRVTGLCEGNPPVTGGFPSQRASNAEMFPFDDVIMIT